MNETKLEVGQVWYYTRTLAEGINFNELTLEAKNKSPQREVIVFNDKGLLAKNTDNGYLTGWTIGNIYSHYNK